MPSGLALGEDVVLSDLAMRYELTGGFIKNALLSALSRAIARDPQVPHRRCHAPLQKDDFSYDFHAAHRTPSRVT